MLGDLIVSENQATEGQITEAERHPLRNLSQQLRDKVRATEKQMDSLIFDLRYDANVYVTGFRFDRGRGRFRIEYSLDFRDAD